VRSGSGGLKQAPSLSQHVSTHRDAKGGRSIWHWVQFDRKPICLKSVERVQIILEVDDVRVGGWSLHHDDRRDGASKEADTCVRCDREWVCVGCCEISSAQLDRVAGRGFGAVLK